MGFDSVYPPFEVLGVCDFCGRGEISRRAEEKVRGKGVMKDNSWEGGYTPEKAAKWSAALKEAAREITRPCLNFALYDGDNGIVCKECLRKMID